MSTIHNIMITFSLMETWGEGRDGHGYEPGHLPEEAKTGSFMKKLDALQEKVFMWIEFVRKEYGCVVVFGGSKCAPCNKDDYYKWDKDCKPDDYTPWCWEEAIKSIDWKEPDAIQVQYMNGDADFDKWKFLTLGNLVEKE